MWIPDSSLQRGMIIGRTCDQNSLDAPIVAVNTQVSTEAKTIPDRRPEHRSLHSHELDIAVEVLVRRIEPMIGSDRLDEIFVEDVQ
jgi:hypothetical protein